MTFIAFLGWAEERDDEDEQDAARNVDETLERIYDNVCDGDGNDSADKLAGHKQAEAGRRKG